MLQLESQMSKSKKRWSKMKPGALKPRYGFSSVGQPGHRTYISQPTFDSEGSL